MRSRQHHLVPDPVRAAAPQRSVPTAARHNRRLRRSHRRLHVRALPPPRAQVGYDPPTRRERTRNLFPRLKPCELG